MIQRDGCLAGEALSKNLGLRRLEEDPCEGVLDQTSVSVLECSSQLAEQEHHQLLPNKECSQHPAVLVCFQTVEPLATPKDISEVRPCNYLLQEFLDWSGSASHGNPGLLEPIFSRSARLALLRLISFCISYLDLEIPFSPCRALTRRPRLLGLKL